MNARKNAPASRGGREGIIRQGKAMGRALCVFALAGAMALACAPAALAEDAPSADSGKTIGKQGSTEMNLMIDETQIVTQVPTQVPIAVKGSGEFTVPPSVHLLNESVFAVHVASVKATVSADPLFHLVALGQPFADATDNDTLWMTVTPGTQDAVALDLSTATGENGVATAPGSWNMAGITTDDDTDQLSLTFAGAVKKATKLMTETAVTAVTVQWTLAAGAPEPASAS